MLQRPRWVQADGRQHPEEGRRAGRADRPVGPQRDERGQGVLASLVGVLVFLLLLLLAVQVVFHLYATSVVTAATFDGARLVAASGGLGEAEAEAHVRSLLGRYGEERVEVSFEPHPDDVVLTVVAESPSVLPATLRRPMRMDRIERTVRVRIERTR